MSSATSIEGVRAAAMSRSPWQFYILLGMAGATVAVLVSRETHPAALILLSAAVVAAGVVGAAIHAALAGFLNRGRSEQAPLTNRTHEALQREKALVLRSIKELEFDRGMGKISEADFHEIGSRLRARALVLMQDLERVETPAPQPREGQPPPARVACGACGTANDADARFCKHCGAGIGR